MAPNIRLASGAEIQTESLLRCGKSSDQGVSQPRGMEQATNMPPRTPPGDPLFARSVGEPKQQIAVTRGRRAPAHQVFAGKFDERAADDSGCAASARVWRRPRAIAVIANPKRIAPLAAAPDVRRMHFGRSSEKLGLEIAQLELALEEMETAEADAGARAQGCGSL